MTVFLRWGIFGIIGVAALLYAYNASKDLASRRTPVAPAAAVIQSVPTALAISGELTPQESAGLSPQCLAELTVARRAVVAHDAQEPLDRLLRIQEIAWLEDAKRRERLERIATHWYAQAGAADPLSMREKVLAECLSAQR